LSDDRYNPRRLISSLTDVHISPFGIDSSDEDILKEIEENWERKQQDRRRATMLEPQPYADETYTIEEPDFATGGTMSVEDTPTPRARAEQERLEDIVFFPERAGPPDRRPDENKQYTPNFATGNVYETVITTPYEYLSEQKLVDPVVDPSFIVPMAGGMGASLAFQQARRTGLSVAEALTKAFARGAATGVSGGIGEAAIAIPTGKAGGGEENGKAMMVNVALGLVSGLTLENAIENVVLGTFKKLSAKQTITATKRLQQLVSSVPGSAMIDDIIKGLNEGSISAAKLFQITGQAAGEELNLKRSMAWADQTLTHVFNQNSMLDATSLFNPAVVGAVGIKVLSELRRTGFKKSLDVVQELVTKRILRGEDNIAMNKLITMYPEVWEKVVKDQYVKQMAEEGHAVKLPDDIQPSAIEVERLETLDQMNRDFTNEGQNVEYSPGTGRTDNLLWNPREARWEEPAPLEETSTQNVLNRLGVNGDKEFQPVEGEVTQVVERTDPYHQRAQAAVAHHLEFKGASTEFIDMVVTDMPKGIPEREAYLRKKLKPFVTKHHVETAIEKSDKYFEDRPFQAPGTKTEADEAILDVGAGPRETARPDSRVATTDLQRRQQIMDDLDGLKGRAWNAEDEAKLRRAEKVNNSIATQKARGDKITKHQQKALDTTTERIRKMKTEQAEALLPEDVAKRNKLRKELEALNKRIGPLETKGKEKIGEVPREEETSRFEKERQRIDDEKEAEATRIKRDQEVRAQEQFGEFQGQAEIQGSKPEVVKPKGKGASPLRKGAERTTTPRMGPSDDPAKEANAILAKVGHVYSKLDRTEKARLQELGRMMADNLLKKRGDKLNSGIDFRIIDREDFEHIMALMQMDISRGKALIGEVFESARETFGRHLPDEVLYAAWDEVNKISMIRSKVVRAELDKKIAQGLKVQPYVMSGGQRLSKWTGAEVMKARFDLETAAEFKGINPDSKDFKELQKLHHSFEIGIESSAKDPMEFSALALADPVKAIRDGYHRMTNIAVRHGGHMMQAIRKMHMGEAGQFRIMEALKSGRPTQLTKKEEIVADMMRDYYNRMGVLLEERGLIDNFAHNYVTTMYKPKKDQDILYAYKQHRGNLTRDDTNPFLLSKLLEDDVVKRMKLVKVTDLGTLLGKYHGAVGKSFSEQFMRDNMLTMTLFDTKLNRHMPIAASWADLNYMMDSVKKVEYKDNLIDYYESAQQMFPGGRRSPAFLNQQGPQIFTRVSQPTEWYQGYNYLGKVQPRLRDAEQFASIPLMIHPDARQAVRSLVVAPQVPRNRALSAVWESLMFSRRMIMIDPLVHGVNVFSNVMETFDFRNPLRSNPVNLYAMGRKMEHDPVKMTEAWEAGLTADDIYGPAADIANDINQGLDIVFGNSMRPDMIASRFSHQVLWKQLRRFQLGVFQYEMEKMMKLSRKHKMYQVKDGFTGIKRAITRGEAAARAAEEVNTRFGALPDHWKTVMGNVVTSWALFAKNWTPSNLKQIAGMTPLLEKVPGVKKGAAKGLEKKLGGFAQQTIPDDLRYMQAARYLRFWAYGAGVAYTTNSLLQYLMTGKFMHENEPDHQFDIAIPDNFAHKEWLFLPIGHGEQAIATDNAPVFGKPGFGRTYLDVLGFSGKTLFHKLHPAWNWIMDMMKNRDSFTNKPYWNDDDPFQQKTGIVLAEGVRRLLPSGFVAALMDWPDPRTGKIMTYEQKMLMLWGSWAKAGINMDKTLYTTLSDPLKEEIFEELTNNPDPKKGLTQENFEAQMMEGKFTGNMGRFLYAYGTRNKDTKEDFDKLADEAIQRMNKHMAEYRHSHRRRDLDKVIKAREKVERLFETNTALQEPYKSMMIKYGSDLNRAYNLEEGE